MENVTVLLEGEMESFELLYVEVRRLSLQRNHLLLCVPHPSSALSRLLFNQREVNLIYLKTKRIHIVIVIMTEIGLMQVHTIKAVDPFITTSVESRFQPVFPKHS